MKNRRHETGQMHQYQAKSAEKAEQEHAVSLTQKQGDRLPATTYPLFEGLG